EPNDRIRRRPDEVADDEVAAIDHPCVAVQRPLDALREIFVWRPVGAPVKLIQLDMRQIQARRELPRQRRLAGAGCADHHDSFHDLPSKLQRAYSYESIVPHLTTKGAP